MRPNILTVIPKEQDKYYNLYPLTLLLAPNTNLKFSEKKKAGPLNATIDGLYKPFWGG